MPEVPVLKESLIEKLRLHIRTHSYREGDFTLASGAKSTFYINLKATTLHPEGAMMVGQAIAEQILKKGIVVDGVGGLTLGADPIATAVSIEGFRLGKSWPAFIVRKESKSHGTRQFLEGQENLKPGAKLLILEDVVTTGGSSVQAIERVREAGYQVAGVFCIVDRLSGGEEAFRKQGVALHRLFTIDQIRDAK